MSKTKALSSFAVTAKPIWNSVFAYATYWFVYDAAQMFVKFLKEPLADEGERWNTVRVVNQNVLYIMLCYYAILCYNIYFISFYFVK